MKPRTLALTLLPSFAVLGGLWLAFLHLMQSNPAFAETVASVSPELASRYSCSCPTCARACRSPATLTSTDQRLQNVTTLYELLKQR